MTVSYDNQSFLDQHNERVAQSVRRSQLFAKADEHPKMRSILRLFRNHDETSDDHIDRSAERWVA